MNDTPILRSFTSPLPLFLLVMSCSLILFSCSSFIDKPTVSPYEQKAASYNIIKESLLEQYEKWKTVPYKNGGLSKKGIDCSGFVMLTFKSKFGITLPRSSEEQMSVGKNVSKKKLRVGDLLFFSTGWFSSHVGIYFENNRFIHVSTRKGVTISSLEDKYWKNAFSFARRVEISISQ